MASSISPEDPEDLAVFISTKDDNTCQKCACPIERGDLMFPVKKSEGLLCMACAGFGAHEYLVSGNVALTRRATQFSTRSAKVLKWSRARKRFERQGTLVEAAALQQAEAACQADAQKREEQREKAAVRRAAQDVIYIRKFSERILELYPRCPTEVAAQIAAHACEKYSGRVGRAAFAKELEENAIVLAVRAHIRHAYTSYDDLLLRGLDRHSARQSIEDHIYRIESNWRKTG